MPDSLLGKRLIDKVTGFTGIAIVKAEYLNGCVQYCLQPMAGKDGKMPNGEYVDYHQLEIIDEGIHAFPNNNDSSSTPGGIMQNTPPNRYQG